MLLVPSVAGASPTRPALCSSKKVIEVPGGVITTLNATGEKISIDAGAIVTVKGNGNCILGDSGLTLQVIGNNNYVSTAGANVDIDGTRNFFSSDGGNVVNCGGSKASLEGTDFPTDCVAT
jgi:hypothetical protein